MKHEQREKWIEKWLRELNGASDEGLGFMHDKIADALRDAWTNGSASVGRL